MTALVRRLARRSRRAGLSRPDQGQGIADRHLSMVRRSSLVDRLSRRGRAEDDVEVPIVYVEPALAGATIATRTDLPVPPTPAVTVVNVAGPNAPPVLEHRVINGPVPTTPPNAAKSQTLVSLASTTPPPPAATPIWAGIPTRAGRDPTQIAEWQRSRPETKRTVGAAARQTSTLVVVARPITPRSSALMARPVWVTPRGVAAAPTSSLPVVVEQRASPAPPTVPTMTTALVAPRLPLVAPVVSGDRHGEETPRPVARSAQPQAAVPSAHQPSTSVPHFAPQAPAIERPAIDIDRLTDTVHARLLRRLTIERERRGVMR